MMPDQLRLMAMQAALVEGSRISRNIGARHHPPVQHTSGVNCAKKPPIDNRS